MTSQLKLSPRRTGGLRPLLHVAASTETTPYPLIGSTSTAVTPRCAAATSRTWPAESVRPPVVTLTAAAAAAATATAPAAMTMPRRRRCCGAGRDDGGRGEGPATGGRNAAARGGPTGGLGSTGTWGGPGRRSRLMVCHHGGSPRLGACGGGVAGIGLCWGVVLIARVGPGGGIRIGWVGSSDGGT